MTLKYFFHLVCLCIFQEKTLKLEHSKHSFTSFIFFIISIDVFIVSSIGIPYSPFVGTGY